MGAAESVDIHTRDGRLLEALVSGPPDGTVLVLHMGTPCGLVPLPATLDPAPMGIRAILYARPGYGRSTPQPGRTVADALGADRFLNLGWSGGGPHALACDALLTDRCLATGVIAGDIEGFRRSVDSFVALLAKATAENVTANTKSAADRQFLSAGYGEWVASFFRAAGVSGSHGAADDYLATFPKPSCARSKARVTSLSPAICLRSSTP
jgi:pimeloyl-ACP methyl ester carboxylesterase